MAIRGKVIVLLLLVVSVGMYSCSSDDGGDSNEPLVSAADVAEGITSPFFGVWRLREVRIKGNLVDLSSPDFFGECLDSRIDDELVISEDNTIRFYEGLTSCQCSDSDFIGQQNQIGPEIAFTFNSTMDTLNTTSIIPEDADNYVLLDGTLVVLDNEGMKTSSVFFYERESFDVPSELREIMTPCVL